MKKAVKTIARINEEGIAFQQVDDFTLVRNEDISTLSFEERRWYSDWCNSGDLLKASFDTDCVSEIEFNFAFRSLELKVKFANSISSGRCETLKKEINNLVRKEKAIIKALDDIGCYMGSTELTILLNILFKKMNVIGGTFSTSCCKLSFDKQNMSLTIDKIVSALDNKEVA